MGRMTALKGNYETIIFSLDSTDESDNTFPNTTYRSRIFDSSYGSSEGETFTILPLEEEMVRSAFKKIMGREKWDVNQIKQLGNWLFSKLLGGPKNRNIYNKVLAKSSATGSLLRLCLYICNDKLLNLPWEYIHDGKTFLVHESRSSLVRVQDVNQPRKAFFSPIKSILLVIPNPSMPKDNPAFDRFDSTKVRKDLQHIIEAAGISFSCIVPPVTIDKLRTALSDESYDAIHFVGHGYYRADGREGDGCIVLEDKKGYPKLLSAANFAGMLAIRKSVKFIYMTACSSGSVVDNVYSGMVQKLIYLSDVQSIVAMQSDVDQTSAIQTASQFYKGLGAMLSPEEALVEARAALSGNQWGVPVIYTHPDGADRSEYEHNRIAYFFGATSSDKSRYAFLLPVWKKGAFLYEKRGEDQLKRPFPGTVIAKEDVMAAWRIAGLLARISSMDKIRLFFGPDPEWKKSKYTHVIAIGSKTNPVSIQILNKFSGFRFECPDSDQWSIVDSNTDACMPDRWCIPNPYKLKEEYENSDDDYGIIAKLKGTTKTYLIIAGLGYRATMACGEYLDEKWSELLAEVNSQYFSALFHLSQRDLMLVRSYKMTPTSVPGNRI